ncbi:MAG: hypothetical protein AAGK47_03050 [Bacteroidota bacterium]
MKRIYFLLLLGSYLLLNACDVPKETTDSTGGGDIPNRRECADVKAVDDTAWMRKAMKEHAPYNVVKYRYKTDGWAYQFTAGNRYLYDCQGTLICVAKGKALDDCARTIMNLDKAQKGQVIYAQKENMD